jgi:chemotaxis protein MotB
MPKRPLIIASILSGLVVIGFLALSAWRSGQQVDEARAEARAKLNEANETIQKWAAQMEDIQRKLKESQARIEDLQREKEAVSAAQQTLEQEMRGALESKDVTISQLQGKLTVNILDHVMFDSGEARLKAGGEGVLQKVAHILTQHPQLKIHVIGHTDNVPIRASARDRFPSNWELSTARATAAVRYLTEKGMVDPRRVGAVGYGEFRPVADNATFEGRAKNRRIAITVLSEELAGADVAPGARTTVPPPASPPAPAGTNAPPPLDAADPSKPPGP